MTKPMKTRKLKNCILYLAKAHAMDVMNLNKSLRLLADNVPDSGWDVLIYHEKDFEKYKGEVVNDLPIKWVEIELKTPPYPKPIAARIPTYYPHPYAKTEGHSGYGHPGFDMGYRHMCRFFSGNMYRHPVLQEYDYYLRLDCDSFIKTKIPYDIFDWAVETGTYYGYIKPAIQLDHPQVCLGLWDNVKRWLEVGEHETYMNFKDIPERTMYYTNFELGLVNWFKTSKYYSFWTFLDSTGGVYTNRWGDAPIKYLGINMFMAPDRIKPVTGFTYQHGATYKL